MRVLLDESVPHRLRHELQGHDVVTARYAGFSGYQNADLLGHAQEAGFDVLVTCDRTYRISSR